MELIENLENRDELLLALKVATDDAREAELRYRGATSARTNSPYNPNQFNEEQVGAYKELAVCVAAQHRAVSALMTAIGEHYSEQYVELAEELTRIHAIVDAANRTGTKWKRKELKVPEYEYSSFDSDYRMATASFVANDIYKQFTEDVTTIKKDCVTDHGLPVRTLEDGSIEGMEPPRLPLPQFEALADIFRVPRTTQRHANQRGGLGH